MMAAAALIAAPLFYFLLLLPAQAAKFRSAVEKFLPVGLLVLSNVFMTFAWYGHLKFPNTILPKVVLVSWGIALLEYCLAVPANRIGHQVYSAAELKTMQEVITLVVFAVFSVLYLKENFTINHVVGFGLICAGAFFVFKGPL
jgi:uncharacterized protein (DUF486 family)